MMVVGPRSKLVKYPPPVPVAPSTSLPSPLDDPDLMYWWDFGWWDQRSYSKISGSNFVYGYSPTDGTYLLRSPTNSTRRSIGFPNSGSTPWGVKPYREISRNPLSPLAFGPGYAIPVPSNFASQIVSSSQTIDGISYLCFFKLEPWDTSPVGEYLLSYHVEGQAFESLGLRFVAGDRIELAWSGSYAQYAVTSSFQITDRNWHHLGFRINKTDQTRVSFFLDGVFYPTNTASFSPASSDRTRYMYQSSSYQASLNIGERFGGSQAFVRHSIYDVMFYTGSIDSQFTQAAFDQGTHESVVTDTSKILFRIPFNEEPYVDRKSFLPMASYIPLSQSAVVFAKTGSAGLDMNGWQRGQTFKTVPREDMRNLFVNSDYTVQVWCSWSQVAATWGKSWGLVGYKGSSATGDRSKHRLWQISMNSNLQSPAGRLDLIIGSGTNGTTTWNSPAPYVQPNTWNMVTFTMRRNPDNMYLYTASLYLNTASLMTRYGTSSLDTSTQLASVSCSLYYGATYFDDNNNTPFSTSQMWFGELGDLRIYSGSRNHDQVIADWASGSVIYRNN